jgi:hypothetical protein
MKAPLLIVLGAALVAGSGLASSTTPARAAIRDAEFEQKMAEVLCVYREVQVLKKVAAGKSNKSDKPVAIVSYDEKPGIQAIAARPASGSRTLVHRNGLCSQIIRQAEAGCRGVAGRGARSRGPPPCCCCSSPGLEHRTGP